MQLTITLICILFLTITFLIADMAGENQTVSRYQESICSKLYTNLLDYKECKLENLDEVIEKIPKIKGGDNNGM